MQLFGVFQPDLPGLILLSEVASVMTQVLHRRSRCPADSQRSIVVGLAHWQGLPQLLQSGFLELPVVVP